MCSWWVWVLGLSQEGLPGGGGTVQRAGWGQGVGLQPCGRRLAVPWCCATKHAASPAWSSAGAACTGMLLPGGAALRGLRWSLAADLGIG